MKLQTKVGSIYPLGYRIKDELGRTGSNWHFSCETEKLWALWGLEVTKDSIVFASLWNRSVRQICSRWEMLLSQRHRLYPSQSAGHYQRGVEANICWSMDGTHKTFRSQRESGSSALHNPKVNNFMYHWQLLYFCCSKTKLAKEETVIFKSLHYAQHIDFFCSVWKSHCEGVHPTVILASCQQI